MHSGGSAIPSPPAMSVSIGIAALILEGRPLSDDYFSEYNSAQSSPSLVAKKSAATHMTSDSLQDAHRIKQKLSQLRSCPGTSKDVAECLVMYDSVVSVTSADELEPDEDALYHQNHNKMDGLFLDSLQSLATTCLRTTPRSFNKTINLNKIKLGGLERTADVLYSPQLSPPFFVEVVEPTIGVTTSKKTEGPKQGPHCDIFLKKIGLLKPMPISDDNNLVEDYHFCNEIFNKTCRRWVFNTNQIKSILNHGEPICIEVFLGPEIKPILMEQWVVQLVDKTAQSTMTLQALCSAIRSQLYFSQISSWTHLLKQEPSDLTDNSRIKTHFNKKPHLDIIYRIKSFKSVSSAFVDKPDTHNFPDTVISETASIRVCLKSAKRFDAIPKFEMSANFPMLVDEQRSTVATCNEKGKHRCMKEYDDEGADGMAECGASGSSAGSSSGFGFMSHRERQLLKYKKRLMKREKKKKMLTGGGGGSTSFDSMVQQQNFSIHASINSIRPPLYMAVASSSSASSSACSSFDSNIVVRNTAMSGGGKAGTAATQTPRVEMMSIGTQTDDFNQYQRSKALSHRGYANTAAADDVFFSFPSCDYCGSDMQCICWNCDNKLFSRNNTNHNNLENSDLLLQSIHRTSSLRKSSASNNLPLQHDGDGSCGNGSNGVVQKHHSPPKSSSHHQQQHHQNHRLQQQLQRQQHHKSQQDGSGTSGGAGGGSERSPCDNLNNLDLIDCRSCIKRQKIKHNYNNNNNLAVLNNNNHPKCGSNMAATADDIVCNYRRTMSESISDYAKNDDDDDKNNGETFNDVPILSTSASHGTGLTFDELKSYRRAFSEDVIDCLDDDDDQLDGRQRICGGLVSGNPKCLCDDGGGNAKIVKLNESQHITPKHCAATINSFPIAAPIFVKCPGEQMLTMGVHHRRDELNSLGRSIPKLNLSSMFEQSSEDHQNSLLVQKSYSAPSFNSPQLLSPRFYKQAAILKRRSRHLSDRSSERSSIGSEEHISDEEYGCGLDNTFSPVLSPNRQHGYLRMFGKSCGLRRRPLLGTLEESLLQNRIQPKFQVQGFKVLLGASGGFCPTQLTIPAVTSLYELQGETFSTPYTVSAYFL